MDQSIGGEYLCLFLNIQRFGTDSLLYFVQVLVLTQRRNKRLIIAALSYIKFVNYNIH